jgi:hypothetical protein
VIEQMRANRREGRFDPSTATRRADFAPHAQPEYKGPVMSPSTGKRKFQAGGKVAKKTAQQMADEMLVRGTKTAQREPVNLSRRGFFGLPESKSMPLAKIDDTTLDKLEKKYAREGQAPALTERTTTVSPDAGKTQSTLRSIVETPVSRRSLLQAAGSQAVQGMLPAGALPTPAGLVANAAASAALPSTAQGLMALALSKGMSADEAIDFVRVMSTRGGKPEPYDIESIARHMQDPSSMEIEGNALPPSEIMRQMLRHDGDGVGSVQSLRGPLREIRQVDPARYQDMMRTARDIADFGFEN